jgi:catechol 2,3-dioxygenase-like lactoylglutathione lyase family enzyme
MIGGLDHINIETENLQQSITFYRDVLGLVEGWRPPFDSVGAWLYAHDKPVVHLVERQGDQREATGRIHHFALSASGIADYERRFNEGDIKFKKVDVPGTAIQQLFAIGPDQVCVELQFNDGQ